MRMLYQRHTLELTQSGQHAFGKALRVEGLERLGRWQVRGAQQALTNPSENSAGTPMTSDGVASYIEQGYLPPTALTFHATASTVLLSSTDTSTAGVARGAGTTFTRVP